MAAKTTASSTDGDGRGVAQVTVGGWPAVESTLRFAELFRDGISRLDPASYVATGSHDTFQLMVRAHMRSPTSSFLLFFISMPQPGGCDCRSTQSSRGTTSTGTEATWERVKAKFPDEDQTSISEVAATTVEQASLIRRKGVVSSGVALSTVGVLFENEKIHT